MELDEKLAEIKNKLSEKCGRFFFGILAEMGCISQFDNAREFQKLMCHRKNFNLKIIYSNIMSNGIFLIDGERDICIPWILF